MPNSLAGNRQRSLIAITSTSSMQWIHIKYNFLGNFFVEQFGIVRLWQCIPTEVVSDNYFFTHNYRYVLMNLRNPPKFPSTNLQKSTFNVNKFAKNIQIQNIQYKIYKYINTGSTWYINTGTGSTKYTNTCLYQFYLCSVRCISYSVYLSERLNENQRKNMLLYVWDQSIVDFKFSQIYHKKLKDWVGDMQSMVDSKYSQRYSPKKSQKISKIELVTRLGQINCWF